MRKGLQAFPQGAGERVVTGLERGRWEYFVSCLQKLSSPPLLEPSEEPLASGELSTMQNSLS